ncbi:ANKRD17, partial [Symbiodinium microadriaticum]
VTLSPRHAMDQAMAAAKYTHIHYCDAHKHINITDGEHSIRDLPLVDSPLIKGKKFNEFFHLVKNVSSADYQTIVDVMNSDNDTYTMLKFFHSKVKVLNYASCDNSDLVKKAFLLLFRIPGEMWMTHSLGQKNITKVGIEHINNQAPLASAKHEQFLWSLLNIRDKDSPIYGWPHHIVGKACANRATGNNQSEPEYFFPLLLRDLNSEFQRTVVPMILPTMLSLGLIVLGKPGIGKTPAAIIMVMAVTRFLIQSRNMDGFLPGWRRSKQIVGFRERPGEVRIPVILDDPLLPSINVEVGENGLVSARYRAAKFVRNQCRVLLNNEWCRDKEPEYVGLSTVTWKQFLAMFQPALNDAPMPHVMATLKQASVIIAGDYVRLAPEHQSQKVHCVSSGGITEDWLHETNKPHYNHYKNGQRMRRNTYAGVLLTIAGTKDFRGIRILRLRVVPQPQQPQVLPIATMKKPCPPALPAPPAKQARIDLNDSDAEPLSPDYED